MTVDTIFTVLLYIEALVQRSLPWAPDTPLRATLGTLQSQPYFCLVVIIVQASAKKSIEMVSACSTFVLPAPPPLKGGGYLRGGYCCRQACHFLFQSVEVGRLHWLKGHDAVRAYYPSHRFAILVLLQEAPKTVESLLNCLLGRCSSGRDIQHNA